MVPALTRALLTACLCFPLAANAALVSRLGGDAYYDDVNEVTWLAEWNDNPGNWNTANSWALGLNVDGVGGWRLPTIAEMDTLDDTYGISVATPGPFSNVTNAFYWSNQSTGISALLYKFETGGTSSRVLSFTTGDATAVIVGDVAAVPLPAAAWLFGSALLGLGWLRRRQG